jgi:hypothetical protein
MRMGFGFCDFQVLLRTFVTLALSCRHEGEREITMRRLELITEDQWLTSSDSLALSTALWRVPKFKQWVFQFHCCQRVIKHVNYKPAHKALAWYERCLWQQPLWLGKERHLANVQDHLRRQHDDVPNTAFQKWSALQALAACLGNGSCETVAMHAAKAQANYPCPTERKIQADILRDTCGNIFCRAYFRQSWRTADSLALAKTIDETQAFEMVPILGDALMDAGCEDEQVLEHCRSSAPHVRGCWLVDMVLGRSDW